MNVKLHKNVIRMSKLGIYVIIVIQSFSMCMAGEITAQQKFLKDISIELSDVQQERSLLDLVSEIEQLTDFRFAYSKKEIRNKAINVEGGQWNLGDLLVEISTQARLSIKRVNESISFLEAKRSGTLPQIEDDIIEQVSITGTITDENGEVLPGATIQEKGTTNGTITNYDGTFSLDVPEDAVLTISFVGYKTMDVSLNGRTILDLTLAADVSALEEVVVVGYGTVKKSDLTGSVSSIRERDFNNDAAITAVDGLLAGKVAGVQVTQSSGAPGSGVSVRVRGGTSISRGNEPLYVIDGQPIQNPGNQDFQNNNLEFASYVEQNPLNSLNPADIESIEVLKDASATAIYGSRGANGVILITTKKGKKGDLRVDYNFRTGIQEVSNKLNMMNGSQYAMLLNEQGVASYSADSIAAIGAGVDWQEEIFRNATIQNHVISLNGGSERSQMYMSLGYFDQEGVVRGSEMKRFSFKLNLSSDVSEHIKVGANINASHIMNNYAANGVQGNERAGVINAAVENNPAMPIRDQNGNYFVDPNIALDNPLALIDGFSDLEKSNNLFGNVFADFSITKSLSLNTKFGANVSSGRRDQYLGRLTQRGGGANGIAGIFNNEEINSLAQATLSYNPELGAGQSLNVLIGTTYEKFSNRLVRTYSQNFTTDGLMTNDLSNGTDIVNRPESFSGVNQLLSYLGRVNYSYAEKYLVTASMRVDGSSRFSEDNRYGFFPSLAVGWNIGNESFMQSIRAVSNAKLRASIGQTGNQNIPNGQSQALLNSSAGTVINGNVAPGFRTAHIPNPDLKWETTTQTNVGFDIGFFAGRLNLTVDYFQKKTQDLLYNVPVAPYAGHTSYLQNAGRVDNNGFEFAINSVVVDAENFEWRISANFAMINNKVVELANTDQILAGNLNFYNNFAIYLEGEPMASYYGYEVAGIFQTGDDIAGSPQPGAIPGDIKFVDQDGDNAITLDDRVILGNPFPDFTFGFNNTFNYKNFDLNIFIEGSVGQDVFNVERAQSFNPINSYRNRYASFYENRWTTENPTNSMTNLLGNEGNQIHSWIIEDASYARLRNVRLGYSIPVESGVLRSLRVYASVDNLLVLTDYTGYDPEVNSFGRNNTKVDFSAYPRSRTYSIGINVGF